jgi:hypothetical protein
MIPQGKKLSRKLAGNQQIFIRVVRLTDDIALDFAAGEKLVGIEILEASRLFKEPGVPVIEIKDLFPPPNGEFYRNQ